MLGDWARYLPLFVKVMPRDYRRVLEEQRGTARELMGVKRG